MLTLLDRIAEALMRPGKGLILEGADLEEIRRVLGLSAQPDSLAERRSYAGLKDLFTANDFMNADGEYASPITAAEIANAKVRKMLEQQ